MIKRFLTPLLFFLFIIIIPPFFYLFNYSQTVSVTNDNTVKYELPYPGLLPDHPLYLLKTVRDNALVFVTRDNVSKARLHLEISDKRVRSAEMLAGAGKTALTVTTLSKGEKHFEQAIESLKSAKAQGETPTGAVLDLMKRSNQKHLEVIERIERDLPQGSQEQLQLVRELNAQNAKELQILSK
jgi:hypothetical protein